MGQIQKENVQIHFQILKLLNQISSAFIKIPYFHFTYVCICILYYKLFFTFQEENQKHVFSQHFVMEIVLFRKLFSIIFTVI